MRAANPWRGREPKAAKAIAEELRAYRRLLRAIVDHPDRFVYRPEPFDERRPAG